MEARTCNELCSNLPASVNNRMYGWLPDVPRGCDGSFVYIPSDDMALLTSIKLFSRDVN